ncbi:hypothetical protein SAMN04487983_1001183 [Streptomyces sp. yr375]|uniref:DUF6585 family protein n=1 Tax=Streptomyces sp. yr375 TaxID=1761906 RepID=UPI0008D809CF|nr:DUF6585 family protein [Streptomyces sp. yr375]SEP64385.1 hypothetical protein SAMN04487983_1001183 [Streptomyces sp. yr375]
MTGTVIGPSDTGTDTDTAANTAVRRADSSPIYVNPWLSWGDAARKIVLMTSLTSASPEAAGLATRHRLGALQGVFAPQRLRRTVFAAHVFNCVMLLPFFLVPGVLYYWFAMRRFPDFNRKRAAQRLHLFEEGLVVHPPSGGDPVVLRWDSLRLRQEIVQRVFNGVPAPTRYVYSASAPGWGAVQITEFYEQPETWGPWMQDAVTRAQATAVLETLGEGGTVEFGSLSLSRTAVHAPKKGALPWPQVREVRAAGGLVRVMATGPSGAPVLWSNNLARDMTNLYLFLAIADNLRKEHSA